MWAASASSSDFLTSHHTGLEQSRSFGIRKALRGVVQGCEIVVDTAFDVVRRRGTLGQRANISSFKAVAEEPIIRDSCGSGSPPKSHSLGIG